MQEQIETRPHSRWNLQKFTVKAILKPTDSMESDPEVPYTKEINQHIPSGFCMHSKFTYGDVENPL